MKYSSGGVEFLGVNVPAGDYTVQEIADRVNASPDKTASVRVNERGGLTIIAPKRAVASIAVEGRNACGRHGSFDCPYC